MPWTRADKQALDQLLAKRKEYEDLHFPPLKIFVVQQLGFNETGAVLLKANASDLIPLLQPFDLK